MSDGGIGTFNLQQNTSFAGTALSLGGATLDFDLAGNDLGGGGADRLAVTKTVSASEPTRSTSPPWEPAWRRAAIA